MAYSAKQSRRRGVGKDRFEQKDEFDQEIIDLARVTRVMAGGKRMRFRATVAIGDHKGRVGIGIAKGADVSLAISKAANDARKHVIKVPMTNEGTIPHEARIRKNSSQLLIKPAPVGTGIIAGSVLRQIIQLTGIRDIVAKIMGTSNKVNNATTLLALFGQLKPPRQTHTNKRPDTLDKKEHRSKEQKKENKDALPANKA